MLFPLSWHIRYFLCFCVLLFGQTLAAQASPPNEVQQKLEQARSNLLISQATEKRVASELENLKRSGKATSATLKDYEIYLNRVQAMVAENQKIVQGMEEAYARHLVSEKTSDYSKPTPSPGTPATAPHQVDKSGELSTLDRELKDSLSSFDQMLLKEMDDIRAQSESKMSALAQEAASAAKRIGEGGEASDESSGGSSSAEGGEKSAAKQQGQEGTQESGKSESGGSYENVPITDGPVEGATSTGGPTSGQRAKRPPGSTQDDDIVARQLREAAEKETDPELKKKLWKEYEDYKKAGH